MCATRAMFPVARRCVSEQEMVEKTMVSRAVGSGHGFGSSQSFKTKWPSVGVSINRSAVVFHHYGSSQKLETNCSLVSVSINQSAVVFHDNRFSPLPGRHFKDVGCALQQGGCPLQFALRGGPRHTVQSAAGVPVSILRFAFRVSASGVFSHTNDDQGRAFRPTSVSIT